MVQLSSKQHYVEQKKKKMMMMTSEQQNVAKTMTEEQEIKMELDNEK